MVRRSPVNRAQKAGAVATPAPVGGWNTRDSLDAMAVEDAVNLDNWFPGLGSCVMRGGSSSYATGLGGTVETLAEFNAGSSRKFIAAANGNLWDISAAGAGVSLASGYASNRWQWAQFDDASGGARMGLVNGSDAPQLYNGTAVSAMTISGSGLTPANLNGIHIYKNRSFFWDDRTQDFWYSATNALGGALTKFPLGRVQGTGGNLLAIGTLSADGGDGPQDYLAFLLNSGDVLLYAGDDPGEASAWALVGRYSIGAPISKRAVRKVGGDLMMVTKAGYIPLATVFAAGRFNEQQASGKIRGAALEATRSYASSFGWDVFHYPTGNQLIINVPAGSGTVQHVMNTETGAWCRFLGLSAQTWGLYNDAPYFAKVDGTVHLYDGAQQFSDAGTPISADGQTAWNYLNDRRSLKRATAIRPLMRTTPGNSQYAIGVGFDFASTIALGGTADLAGPAAAEWDEALWDAALWSSSYTLGRWHSIKGMGYAISARLAVSSSEQRVEWLSNTYLAERGGVIA